MDDKLKNLPEMIDKETLLGIRFREQNRENVYKRIASYQEKPKGSVFKKFLMNGVAVVVCSCFISFMIYFNLFPDRRLSSEKQISDSGINLAILTRADEVTEREYKINTASMFKYDSDTLNITLFVPNDFDNKRAIELGNFYLDEIYELNAKLNGVPKNEIIEKLEKKYSYTINIAKSKDYIFPDLPDDYILKGTKGKDSNQIIWQSK